MNSQICILTVCLTLCANLVCAQEPVTLSFSYPSEQEKTPISPALGQNRIENIETTVSGRIAERKYLLAMVHSIDGTESRKPLGTFTSPTDSLRFEFTYQPISADSVQVILLSPEKAAYTKKIAGAERCILLETTPESPLNTAAAIPVIAFCQGKPIEITTAGGLTLNGMNYCDVRNAAVHPSKWHAQFGLKDYIYFEIRFTDK